MKELCALLLLALLTGLLVCFASIAHAEGPRKEYVRLQATEFCAAVKQPPHVIADALNSAVKQDPKTWLPAILWWNAIVDKYKQAGCDDA